MADQTQQTSAAPGSQQDTPGGGLPPAFANAADPATINGSAAGSDGGDRPKPSPNRTAQDQAGDGGERTTSVRTGAGSGKKGLESHGVPVGKLLGWSIPVLGTVAGVLVYNQSPAAAAVLLGLAFLAAIGGGIGYLIKKKGGGLPSPGKGRSGPGRKPGAPAGGKGPGGHLRSMMPGAGGRGGGPRSGPGPGGGRTPGAPSGGIKPSSGPSKPAGSNRPGSTSPSGASKPSGGSTPKPGGANNSTTVPRGSGATTPRGTKLSADKPSSTRGSTPSGSPATGKLDGNGTPRKPGANSPSAPGGPSGGPSKSNSTPNANRSTSPSTPKPGSNPNTPKPATNTSTTGPKKSEGGSQAGQNGSKSNTPGSTKPNGGKPGGAANSTGATGSTTCITPAGTKSPTNPNGPRGNKSGAAGDRNASPDGGRAHQQGVNPSRGKKNNAGQNDRDQPAPAAQQAPKPKWWQLRRRVEQQVDNAIAEQEATQPQQAPPGQGGGGKGQRYNADGGKKRRGRRGGRRHPNPNRGTTEQPQGGIEVDGAGFPTGNPKPDHQRQRDENHRKFLAKLENEARPYEAAKHYATAERTMLDTLRQQTTQHLTPELRQRETRKFVQDYGVDEAGFPTRTPPAPNPAPQPAHTAFDDAGFPSLTPSSSAAAQTSAPAPAPVTPRKITEVDMADTGQFTAMVDASTPHTLRRTLSEAATAARRDASGMDEKASNLRCQARQLEDKPGMREEGEKMLREAAALEETAEGRRGMAAGFDDQAQKVPA